MSFERINRPNRLRFNPARFTLCASALLRHSNCSHHAGDPTLYGAGSVNIHDIYAFGGGGEEVSQAYRYADRKRQTILAEHGYNEETFEHEFRSRVRWNYRMHCLLSLMLEA